MQQSHLQLYRKETPTQVFYCCEIFKNTYFEEHLCRAASELTLESDVRNFVSGKSLSKPSWLGNITKIPVAFKSLNLVSVCSSLTVTTQKANVYSPWTPCSNFMCKCHTNIKHQVYFRLSKEHSINVLSIHPCQLHWPVTSY